MCTADKYLEIKLYVKQNSEQVIEHVCEWRNDHINSFKYEGSIFIFVGD